MMNSRLAALAECISFDGPVNPNDANQLCLAYDFEEGWICGFRQGIQWILVVETGETPAIAVENAYMKASALWPARVVAV